MAAKCGKCGRSLESADAVCRCAPAAYVLTAEPGEYRITGQSVGMVVEGPLDGPDGRRVDSRPTSGGRAYSTTNAAGEFSAELWGSLEWGRRAEGHALRVLVNALCARGDQVEVLSGARDDCGEDAILSINGHSTPVQVVVVPADSSLWKDLGDKKAAGRQGKNSDAVEIVRQAFLHKKHKAHGMLLLLDAANIGAIISQALVESYRAAYGDPAEEFSLIDAWIVGPTAKSAIQLSASRNVTS